MKNFHIISIFLIIIILFMSYYNLKKKNIELKEGLGNTATTQHINKIMQKINTTQGTDETAPDVDALSDIISESVDMPTEVVIEQTTLADDPRILDKYWNYVIQQIDFLNRESNMNIQVTNSLIIFVQSIIIYRKLTQYLQFMRIENGSDMALEHFNIPDYSSFYNIWKPDENNLDEIPEVNNFELPSTTIKGETRSERLFTLFDELYSKIIKNIERYLSNSQKYLKNAYIIRNTKPNSIIINGTKFVSIIFETDIGLNKNWLINQLNNITYDETDGGSNIVKNSIEDLNTHLDGNKFKHYDDIFTDSIILNKLGKLGQLQRAKNPNGDLDKINQVKYVEEKINSTIQQYKQEVAVLEGLYEKLKSALTLYKTSAENKQNKMNGSSGTDYDETTLIPMDETDFIKGMNYESFFIVVKDSGDTYDLENNFIVDGHVADYKGSGNNRSHCQFTAEKQTGNYKTKYNFVPVTEDHKKKIDNIDNSAFFINEPYYFSGKKVSIEEASAQAYLSGSGNDFYNNAAQNGQGSNCIININDSYGKDYNKNVRFIMINAEEVPNSDQDNIDGEGTIPTKYIGQAIPIVTEKGKSLGYRSMDKHHFLYMADSHNVYNFSSNVPVDPPTRTHLSNGTVEELDNTALGCKFNESPEGEKTTLDKCLIAANIDQASHLGLGKFNNTQYFKKNDEIQCNTMNKVDQLSFNDLSNANNSTSALAVHNLRRTDYAYLNDQLNLGVTNISDKNVKEAIQAQSTG